MFRDGPPIERLSFYEFQHEFKMRLSTIMEKVFYNKFSAKSNDTLQRVVDCKTDNRYPTYRVMINGELAG